MHEIYNTKKTNHSSTNLEDSFTKYVEPIDVKYCKIYRI